MGIREQILKADSIEEAVKILGSADLREASASTINRCALAVARRQKGKWAPPKPKAEKKA